jgi:hypothetical protein
MTIKINSWKPDTCGCILHYTWDDSVSQDQIKTEFFAIEHACPEHAPAVVQEPTDKEKKKADKLKVIKDALDLNEERNLKDNQATIKAKGLMAAMPEAKLKQALDTHKAEVTERYEHIFSNTKKNQEVA